MASLFWVGGSTAYDGVTNTMATTTGGTATVAAITSADTVTFDANSPAAAAVTTTAAISATALTLGAGFTGSLTLGNTLTTSGALTLTQGTLNTNGQTCSWASFSSSAATARTLTLGASQVTCSGAWNCATTTNLTVNPGTSTINLTGTSQNFNWGAGFTFNNLVGSGASGLTITGTHTFNNFTRTGTAAKTDALSLASNITVTGTFTANGNSTVNRLIVQSSITGTQRTITAATVTASNVDFSDILGAGAANWNLSAITGLSGDAGGNSSITLTTGATQYRIGASSTSTLWSDSTKWASTSGGVGGTGRIPLPQDDVIIDNNSSALNVNVPIDMFRAGRTIDVSGFTRGGTFGNPFTNTATNIYGSLIVGSIVFTSAATQAVTFAGRGNYTLASNNNFNSTITITAPTGTYTLNNTLVCSGAVTHADGTFIDNGFSVSVSSFISNSSRTRTLTKTGAWSLTSTAAASVWNLAASGLTLTDTGSVSITTTSISTRTFAGAAQTYGTLNYTVAGSTGTLVLTGNNTFSSINVSDASNARVFQLSSGTTTTVTDVFNVNGTSGKLMTVSAFTPASAATLSLANGCRCYYLSIQDITVTGGSAEKANAYMSTNVSGNTGWNFLDQGIQANNYQFVKVGDGMSVSERIR